MRPQRQHHAAKTSTGNDRLVAALQFVWGCRDNVFASTNADAIATMKGVTKQSDRETVAAACVKRRAEMRGDDA